MDVHVVLRVDVIERQTRLRERFELRANLGLQLAARTGMKEIAHARRDEVAWEIAVAIDQIRNLRRRQLRASVHKNDVQPDRKRRQRTCARDGILRTGSSDHQAGRSQNPFAVRALDRIVDGRREAEIVRGYDQLARGSNAPRKFCPALAALMTIWAISGTTRGRSKRGSNCAMRRAFSLTPAFKSCSKPIFGSSTGWRRTIRDFASAHDAIDESANVSDRRCNGLHECPAISALDALVCNPIHEEDDVACFFPQDAAEQRDQRLRHELDLLGQTIPAESQERVEAFAVTEMDERAFGRLQLRGMRLHAEPVAFDHRSDQTAVPRLFKTLQLDRLTNRGVGNRRCEPAHHRSGIGFGL